MEAVRTNRVLLVVVTFLVALVLSLAPLSSTADAHKACFGSAGVGFIHDHNPPNGPPKNWQIYKITQAGPNQIAKHFRSWVVNRYSSTLRYQGYVLC
jgi:hypothetical protein